MVSATFPVNKKTSLNWQTGAKLTPSCSVLLFLKKALNQAKLIPIPVHLLKKATTSVPIGGITRMLKPTSPEAGIMARCFAGGISWWRNLG